MEVKISRFNAAMRIPAIRPEIKEEAKRYEKVEMSPSAIKVISDLKKSENQAALLNKYEQNVAMKGGTVTKFSDALLLNKSDYDYLRDKAGDLQPANKARIQILASRGREFASKKCAQDTPKQIGGAFKIAEDPEEWYAREAERELTLRDRKMLLYEQFPEIVDFNRDVAACQVHACQGIQLQQKEALAKLRCRGKDNYISDLKADDREIVKETEERKEENEKKLNLLLLLKAQLDEKELREKIAWEERQSQAMRNTKMDFEMSRLEMEDAKKEEKKREQFRKDLKNMITYNEDAVRYKAKERRLLLKRESDFLKEKELFNESLKKKNKGANEDFASAYEKVYAVTKKLNEERAIKDQQYQEWVIWDTEKKLKEREEKISSKASRMAANKSVIEQREFLKKFQEDENQRIKDLEKREHENNLKWMNFNDILQSAEPLNRSILRDVVRYLVLDQINDNELRRDKIREEKFNEGTLAKSYQHAYDTLIRNRQRQKFKKEVEYVEIHDETLPCPIKLGLPKTYGSHIRRKYKL